MLKHSWFWMVMTLVAVFILPAIFPSTTYEHRIFSEVSMLEHTLGEGATTQIMGITNKYYDMLIEDSGCRAWVMEHYYVVDQDVKQGAVEGGAPVGVAAQLTQNYAVSLFLNIYELIFRLTQVFIWSVYSLPFILAALIDGAMQRKAKAVSFSYSSPSVYNATWHLVIALIFSSFFYFNTPFPVPPILFPIFIGAATFVLRSLVANLQRSA